MAIFKKVRYFIEWNGAPDCKREVTGYAFEVEGWPEFRACVRFGNRFHEFQYGDAWICDHWETGKAVSEVGHLKSRADAPAKLKELLESKGRERVLRALANVGVTPTFDGVAHG